MTGHRLLTYLIAISTLFVVLIVPARAQSLVSEHGFDLAPLHIETANGPVALIVEIADTSKQRAKGLMHRTELPDSDGMLFIWPDRALRHFWMKDTVLSLDILFFDEEGVLFHVAESQEPYSEKLIPSLMPASYALEIIGGRTQLLGIEIGDKIHPLPKR